VADRITNLKFFKSFFEDSRNDTIVKTIKQICLADQPTPIGTTGDLFAYRAGRQDVWNEILALVNADIEQEQKQVKKLQEMQDENGI